MKKVYYAVLAVVCLLAGAIGFQQLTAKVMPEHALYYQQPRMLSPFTLTDHQGNSFTNQTLAGQWTWVFFGYTSCPDVCPTTLQKLTFIYDDLQKIASNQVLMVSVDPKRDSQEKLANYIAYFHPDFIALRAGHEVLFPFSRNLGLMYAITDGDDANIPEHYLVNHSASMVLINPQGHIVAIFKPEQGVGQVPSIDGEKLLTDFARIVQLAS